MTDFFEGPTHDAVHALNHVLPLHVATEQLTVQILLGDEERHWYALRLDHVGGDSYTVESDAAPMPANRGQALRSAGNAMVQLYARAMAEYARRSTRTDVERILLGAA